jgi:glycosyltransferase involved in cell wall biosynthesis
MVKLSIIIPFYETYDLTCNLLKVLAIQKTDEVEIILIDDGNEERLEQFKDIAIIKHLGKKTGVSHARNTGLDIAKGQYIAFVDSDDMITIDYINVLLNAIEKAPMDIIYFNWADFNQNLIVRHPQNFAVWKAIYRREIVPRFLEEVEFNEDVFFQEELAKKVYNKHYIDRVLYIYNSNRVGSQMWRRDRR